MTTATPGRTIRLDITSACGYSPCSDSLEYCSPTCCGGGNWGRTGMGLRRSPPAINSFQPAKNVPISEDCDSKFGIGFMARKASLLNPGQAKDFGSFSI